MLTLAITVEGKTWMDLKTALDQVKAELTNEKTSGFEINDHNKHSFLVIGGEESFLIRRSDGKYVADCTDLLLTMTDDIGQAAVYPSREIAQQEIDELLVDIGHEHQYTVIPAGTPAPPKSFLTKILGESEAARLREHQKRMMQS